MTVSIKIVDKPSIGKSDAMDLCVKVSSQIWEGRVDDEVACVLGLVKPTIMSDKVYLWLYTNELVDQHKFLMVRHSQRLVEKMLETYQGIYGHVKADSPRSIRWLKWLGASFGDPDGQLRMPFEIRRK